MESRKELLSERARWKKLYEFSAMILNATQDPFRTGQDVELAMQFANRKEPVVQHFKWKDLKKIQRNMQSARKDYIERMHEIDRKLSVRPSHKPYIFVRQKSKRK